MIDHSNLSRKRLRFHGMEEVRGPKSPQLHQLTHLQTMFQSFITHLEPLLQTYGVFGMFFASIIEEIIAPIPSTLVVFSGSVLLTKGLIGSEAILAILLKIVIPASLGMAIGSLFPYYLARVGEKVAIDRFGKYLGISWESVEKVQKWSQNSYSDELLIFFTRAIPGMPSLAVSLLAGIARIPVTEFFIWSLLGALPRTFILGLAGWWGGKKFAFIMQMITKLESHMMVIILAVMLSVLIFLFLSQRKRSSKA